MHNSKDVFSKDSNLLSIKECKVQVSYFMQVSSVMSSICFRLLQLLP